MNYRRLGKSGLQVRELSFGAWVTFAQQITEQIAEELMTIAYDGGVNFFDDAEVYAAGKAEIVTGNILKRRGWTRTLLSSQAMSEFAPQMTAEVMKRIEGILRAHAVRQQTRR